MRRCIGDAGYYSPVGLVRDSYTLFKTAHFEIQMRNKETGRYGVKIPYYNNVTES